MGRLETAPLEYAEVQPRRELEQLFLAVALAAVLVLVGARRRELVA